MNQLLEKQFNHKQSMAFQFTSSSSHVVVVVIKNGLRATIARNNFVVYLTIPANNIGLGYEALVTLSTNHSLQQLLQELKVS